MSRKYNVTEDESKTLSTSRINNRQAVFVPYNDVEHCCTKCAFAYDKTMCKKSPCRTEERKDNQNGYWRIISAKREYRDPFKFVQ